MISNLHDTPDDVWDRIQQHAVDRSGFDVNSQLRDRSMSLSNSPNRVDDSRQLREANIHLTQEIDKQGRHTQRLLSDKHIATNKLKLSRDRATLLETELHRLQEENTDLHYKHISTIGDLQKLDESLHEQSHTIESYRNKEITRLRDAVGKSVRSPMRDTTHKKDLHHNSIPRSQRSTKTSDKQAKLLERKNVKIEELKAELTATLKENDVLRQQNVSIENELQTCNSEKDSYAKLLLSSPSGAPKGAATSVEVAVVMLAEIRSRILTQTEEILPGSSKKVHSSLEGVCSMWGVGGVDHIPSGSIINSNVDEMQRYIETEQNRLSTLQKLLTHF